MTIIFDRSKKISLDDESFRSELLSIASKIDDVIPLGRGDPDFHTPKHIVDAAKKALDDNKHHYTPPNGLPELRVAISKNLLKKYNLNYSENEINERTKVIVLVSPNNPTGAVTPPENIKKIAEIAIKHNLIVIADEIYADLIYENHQHLSIGTLENMKERTLTLNGFSKTYAMTGWRIGYIAGPEDIIKKMSEIRHSLSINSCTFSQFGALAALEGPQDDIIRMKDEYNIRRKFCMKALDDIGFSYGDPGGAFYIYTSLQVFK